MRFLRAVCGRRAALCGETEGRTPTRDAASRAVAPLPPQSAATACALRESGPPARFLGFSAPNVSQNHAPCMVSKRVGFAKRKKGRTPARDAASRAVAPLPLQSAATACALRESGPPARFLGFSAPNVSQNHAPCMVSKRVGFAKRKKGRTPARDAASRVVAPSFLRNPQRRLCRHAFWDSARRMSLKTMRLARFPSASALPTRKKGRTPARDAASGLSFRRWRCFGCGSCGRRCRRGRPAPRACRTRRCARPG